jgi:histidine triad (HIT) family protein
MSETVFAKIIRGEIPCHPVYEDEHVLAFLDINPLSRGHTLIVTKEPVETIDQVSDAAGAAIGRALVRVSRAVVAATGCLSYNILQNNGAGAHQAVMHVHFHVIPKYPDGSGLGIGWKPGALDADAGKALAAEIHARL